GWGARREEDLGGYLGEHQATAARRCRWVLVARPSRAGRQEPGPVGAGRASDWGGLSAGVGGVGPMQDSFDLRAVAAFYRQGELIRIGIQIIAQGSPADGAQVLVQEGRNHCRAAGAAEGGVGLASGVIENELG